MPSGRIGCADFGDLRLLLGGEIEFGKRGVVIDPVAVSVHEFFSRSKAATAARAPALSVIARGRIALATRGTVAPAAVSGPAGRTNGLQIGPLFLGQNREDGLRPRSGTGSEDFGDLRFLLGGEIEFGEGGIVIDPVAVCVHESFAGSQAPAAARARALALIARGGVASRRVAFAPAATAERLIRRGGPHCGQFCRASALAVLRTVRLRSRRVRTGKPGEAQKAKHSCTQGQSPLLFH